ncbi:MAG: heme A synthase [Rhodospirillaceae bacterium]|nr:heme A synthase [Rhodospirillaceae bacterium]MBT5809496.1 heme A synthase [Rhodospirillaceae bacterium]
MNPLAPPSRTPHQGVVGWLYLCCFMVIAMMVIGAITRLTESGLSIVEWKPLIGALPPLSAHEWTRIFELYQQTSEYKLANAGMTLAEFKSIFWWEYIHRLWGRLIGVVFGLPFVFFLFTKRLPSGKTPHLVALFALGGAQGLIGWWMVKSGFVDRTDVSQYRLTIHLGMAFFILGYLLWVAMDITHPRAGVKAHRLRPMAMVVTAAAFVTILSGGLVAGSNAGFVYNTWPFMDGGVAPQDFLELDPWWLNPFENLGAIQFDHRVMAYLTTGLVILLWVKGRSTHIDDRARRALSLLMLSVMIQIALGVTTLLLVVPLPVAVLHQLGAATVFCLSVWSLHALHGEKATEPRREAPQP